jgi:predicted alpha/beta superfamily hydrolase
MGEAEPVTGTRGHDLRVTVNYPPGRGRILLRTDQDWERDVEPVAVSDDGTRSDFALESRAPYRYFKPILRVPGGVHWANGHNYLVVADLDAAADVYPHFEPDARCSVCERVEAPSDALGQPVSIRIFYPPGYAENDLESFPVLYMQDGRNLFVTPAAPARGSWRVAETLNLLDDMNATQRIIVVGVDPPVRERDYTADGYETFGRFMAEELKPLIDGAYRTRSGPGNTAVMGSSLGAVASFFLAWQWPEVFGLVGCLSPSFGLRDNLLERVESETRRPLRIYLDSGWPEDNFEMARTMRAALVRGGYEPGRELLYLAFPLALHDERHWAMRCHLPFQYFFGTPARGFRSATAP